MRNARFLARCRPDPLRKAANHWLCFGEWYIMFKSVLSGDRFCGPVGNDMAVIDAAGKFVQSLSVTAEIFFQRREIEVAELLDCFHSKFLQPLSGHFAYARQSPNWQRQEKPIHFFRLNHEQSIW